MRINFIKMTLLMLCVFGCCYILVNKWYELLNLRKACKITRNQQNGDHQNKSKLLLVIGILSKLSAIDRRESIRYSWLKICKENHKKVSCNFFTDSLQDESKENISKYKKEESMNKDLIFMPFKGGMNFGVRLYWMLKWSMDNYDFQYFLRIDDDYFLCLDRLLYELPQRPKNGLYWGYLHCTNHVVRIDEGWMILSRDFINESINKFNTTLQCHPFGDQAVALWVKNSKLNITYFSDKRVIHAATAFQSEKYLQKNICEKHLGLHGSYGALMLKYWILYKEWLSVNLHFQYEIPKIKPYSSYCEFKKDFDWRFFWSHVRYAPKLCKDSPSWNITETWVGRENMGHEAIF